MVFGKNRISIHTRNASTSIKTKLMKTTIAALTISSLSLSGGMSSAFAKDPNLTTVYYVYLNNEYLGTVSDKDVVDEVINAKINQEKQSFEKYDLSVGNQLTFIPEQVFNSDSKINNQKVVQEIKEELKVQADATALLIDGKPITYVEDEKVAQEVIHTLKLQYVSKKQLEAVEKRKENPEAKLPPLKSNKSRIMDVRLSKDVTIAEGKIEPEKILSLKEAVKFLEKGTLEEKKYKVKEGDVLGSIASDHHMDLEKLLSLNKGLKEDSLINIGDEINVTVTKPIVTVIIDKETNKNEKMKYETEVIEDSSMYKGDKTVKQKGKNGKRSVTYIISEENGKEVKRETIKETIISKPVKRIIVKGTKVIPSRGDGSFSWPTSGGYISSQMGYRWGKIHKGIDIARPSNYTITAADNGVVVSAGWDGGYGNKITIDHQNGYRTVYGHLASISVQVGQTVPKGTQIGVMGSTGDSTGVHLHFEVYKNGTMKNPLSYLR
ncbi:M23 family metallopeptidase [Bacillus massilinigeriensis]|uniref:M23 family metallopeptidase n=1 Tax=Bacillus massilionigeriensis TaxID=1805475 RepID=UPI00096AE7FA|nr:M23 family metallopeptidase [Bacillus massilionigeriensis]